MRRTNAFKELGSESNSAVSLNLKKTIALGSALGLNMTDEKVGDNTNEKKNIAAKREEGVEILNLLDAAPGLGIPLGIILLLF
jgi:hypothetical protein